MRRAIVVIAILAVGLSATRSEPPEKVDENSAVFEIWLRDRGLEPLNGAQAIDLLSDKTFYGRYADLEGRWIEYYSRGGVNVFQPKAEQDPKRRVVYFGTWWAEKLRTCFSYPEQNLDCYRLYRDRDEVYFVRTENAGYGRPAGSLSVAADRIEPGNSENYPFVAN